MVDRQFPRWNISVTLLFPTEKFDLNCRRSGFVVPSEENFTLEKQGEFRKMQIRRCIPDDKFTLYYPSLVWISTHRTL